MIEIVLDRETRTRDAIRAGIDLLDRAGIFAPPDMPKEDHDAQQSLALWNEFIERERRRDGEAGEHLTAESVEPVDRGDDCAFRTGERKPGAL
jgi:hypothetical protein